MLTHQGTSEIKTKRLLLRPFTLADAHAMYHGWASDADVSRYMRWQCHKDVAETEDTINRWVAAYHRPSFYQWALTLIGDDTPVGCIGLFVLNESDHCGGVAYCIGKAYWGQGIVSEALRPVLTFGLMDVGFNRIEAYHSTQNPASGRVMEKAGMHFEGLMRQKYRSIMGYEDSRLYAILREDLDHTADEPEIKLEPYIV